MLNLQHFTSEAIPLESLPQWSPWPARLLQLNEWTQPIRTVQKVDKEYDKEEYFRCLQFKKERKNATPDEVRSYEFRLPRDLCVSQKNKLFVLPSEKVLAADNSMLLETLTPFMNEVEYVVELGCGYGYNLWTLRNHFPEKNFLGGDYSPNAVTLAGLLYAEHSNIGIEQFNYYDDTYALLERCPPNGKTLLYTRHSIEQLPSAKKLFETLTQYFDRLSMVVHMEVALENYGDDLLDLMRKRYVAVNDYNRDLVGLVRSRPDIELLRNDSDEFGFNALNPSSVIVWRPRSL